MDNDECYGCTERKLHCHATCERHLKAKAAREQKKELIRKAKNENKVVADVLYHDVPNKAKTALRLRMAKKKKY